MGNCCSGDADTGNQNLTNKKASKGGVGGGYDATNDVNTSDNIFDFANANVKDIIDKDGEYASGKFSSDGTNLEERAMCTLENNSRY